jgi:phage pi2 protein 07
MDNNNAHIGELIFTGKLNDLSKEFGEKTLLDFLKAATTEGFEKGPYTYYCKQCGGQWSFNDKEYRKLFEKFHKTTGCSFQYSAKEKNNKTLFSTKRSRGNYPPEKETEIMSVIRELSEENNAEAKTDMSTEPQTQTTQ